MIDWKKFLARVVLRFPMPMSMIFDSDARTVTWWFYVLDHLTGEYRWIESIPIPVPDTEDEWEALRWVRYWTQVTALHELDECIIFDGQRPFDPHRVVPLPRWDT